MVLDRLRSLFSSTLTTAEVAHRLEERVAGLLEVSNARLSALNEHHAAATQLMIGQVATNLGLVANEVNATLNIILPQRDLTAALDRRIDTLQAQLQSMVVQIAEVDQRIAVAQASINSAANDLLSAGEPPQLTQMVQALGAVANEVNATLNAVLPQRDQLAEIANRTDSLQQTVSLLRTKLSDTASHLMSAHEPPQFAELANQIAGLVPKFASPEHVTDALNQHSSQDRATLVQIAAALGAVANEVNATLNAVLPNRTDMSALNTRLDNLTLDIAAERERSAAQSSLSARNLSALLQRTNKTAAMGQLPIASPRRVPSLDQQMTEFKKLAPHNFAAWHKAYKAGIEEGLRTTTGNLSDDGHVGANIFRMFLNVHARGRLIDIGCGPLSMPSYLADWPVEDLAGIDPQQPFTAHPFAFVQTFAETIPWPDHSFETVVVATSLDHVYLLDRSLAEIKRVLTLGGRLLLWTGMFDHTQPYNPYGPAISAPDTYHLFHPGRNWFYELLIKDYRLLERMPTIAAAEFLAFEAIGQK